jgi:hypothetical protein
MVRDEFLGAAGFSDGGGGGGAASNYIFSGAGFNIQQFFWTSSGFSATPPNTVGVPQAILSRINTIAVHPTQQFVAAGVNASNIPFGGTDPFVQVYPWTNSGFGTRVASPSSTFIPGSVYGLEFSPSGGALAIQYNNVVGQIGSGPSSLVAYTWTGSGYGLKYTDPSPAPQCGSTGGIGGGGNTDVTFSRDGAYVAATTDQSPYIYVYGWSDSTGFGAKKANPSTGIPNQGSQCVFNNAGTAIAVAHLRFPFLSVYPWSSSGFGAKYSNPSFIPLVNEPNQGYGRKIAFAPNDTHLIAGYIGKLSSGPDAGLFGETMVTYNWSSSGFGTTITSPTTTRAPLSIAFSGDGAYVSLSTLSPDTYMAVYPWSASGYGTRVANPAYSTSSGIVRFR